MSIKNCQIFNLNLLDASCYYYYYYYYSEVVVEEQLNALTTDLKFNDLHL